ncbi:hypothetical protein SDC9_73388 [bioreactor metagenome]|uniref:Uncharacterized protein n=1 Tax=bioreactor metagenome TaxID=1076179 RepID=A0A644YK47_9ZZZZ
MAADFVITISSPGFMPTSALPRACRATTVALVTGRVTESVTSVCPPRISTLASCAAVERSSAILPISSRLLVGGSSRVTSRPTGSAPAAAASLQQTCTVSLPRCVLLAEVIGSQLNTIKSFCMSSVAQSCPMAGAERDSGLTRRNLWSTSRSKSSLSSLPSRSMQYSFSNLFYRPFGCTQPINFKNSSSVNKGIFSSLALSSLLPALSP